MKNEQKSIVLDANILLRAVLGVRVGCLLEAYDGLVSFHSPDVCFADALKSIPDISAKRGIDPSLLIFSLKQLSNTVDVVDRSAYEEYESAARYRIGHRDVDDWPVVAASLLLNCPVWTEDQDFFGSGVPTWTTQTIELYLRDA